MLLNLTVRVSDIKGFSLIAQLRDVSTSGGFLVTPAEIPELSILRIQLRRHGAERSRPDTVLEAVVVRRGTGGIGIEWLEFSPAALIEVLRKAGAAPAQQPAQPRADIPDRYRPPLPHG